MGEAKVKQQRKRAPRSPTDQAEEARLAAATAEEPTPWATSEDLGTDQDFEDVVLPVKQVKVRVRFLATPDVALLQRIPDLAGYTDLVNKLRQGKVDEVPDAEFISEQLRWQAHLAHLAVANHTEPEVPRTCFACDPDAKEPMYHKPSLWSVRQTARLHPRDLDFIAAVALKAQVMRPLGDSSTAPTEGASQTPATSGE